MSGDERSPLIAVPAVDLKDGRCVQLVGGVPEDERVSLPDPVRIARQWWDTGFRTLHVVDLDAALGRGDNRETVRRILEESPAVTQVGGGVRTRDEISAWIEIGADRVVVGTRAVQDHDWLEKSVAAHPERIVVAADVRDDEVLVRGWTEGSGVAVDVFLDRLAPLPIAGVLCTDVGREGRMEGIDREAVRRVVEAAEHRVWISGGIATMKTLEFLSEVGAAGAVLGMALYTGTLDAPTVAKEYGG